MPLFRTASHFASPLSMESMRTQPISKSGPCPKETQSRSRKRKQERIETNSIKRKRTHLNGSEREPFAAIYSWSSERNHDKLFGNGCIRSSFTGLTSTRGLCKLGKYNSGSCLIKRDEKKRQKRQARSAKTEKMELEPVLRAPKPCIPQQAEKISGPSNLLNASISKSEKRGNESNGFVGTCQNLEKPFSRLSTFPKAEEVRPLSILMCAYEHIKRRFNETRDFAWANEQMKSLRQDLTVQGIRNEFVLGVYETHARMALKNGALNEFNQCQTMIKSLTLGLSNETDHVVRIPAVSESFTTTMANPNLFQQTEEAVDEFVGYRLLFALVQKNWADVTKELVSAAVIMTRNQNKTGSSQYRSKRMWSCKHAILVTRAVTRNDYHSFFVLYDNAPHLSGFLMDSLVQGVREEAFKSIVSDCRPTASVEFFRETLFFHDLDATRSFLEKSGAKFVKEAGVPPFWVDCKASNNTQ